jgi:hypothetical protein
MRAPSNALRVALLALLVAGLVGGGTGAVHSAFFSTTSNPTSNFTAKRIFPGDRTTSAWDFQDAADGSAATVSDPLAFADGTAKTTKNWATTFSATRYLEFDMVASRAAGLAVTSPTFDFRYRPTTATDNVCFYIEVRSIASGSLIATYGSSGSPLQCVTGAAYTTVSTPIPAISTTDLMNDLRLRVYARNVTGARSIQVDAATVGGSAYDTFTLYPNLHVDRADGTVQTNLWSLATADGAVYYATGNWTTAYSATRWVTFGVDGYVPSGATVTGATLTHTYRSARNGSNLCYYFEVYDGATLVGSHGSTGSDVSCNSSNATWVTDTVPLPEVNSVSRANNMVIKLYAKSSAPARGSEHDRVHVTFSYYLD